MKKLAPRPFRRCIILMAGWLAGCTTAGTPPFHSTSVPSPETDATLIARLPLTPESRVRLALPFPQQRAALVADIRRNVRQADAAADDAALEQALAVIGALRREDFVPPALHRYAYLPVPLSIGYGQTISDAYIVAVMTAAVHLKPDANVLDIGTGSGYQAAVLARLAGHVSSIEIVEPLAAQAARRLHRLGYGNVEVRAGDGFAGWPERAPFDAIIVAAGAASVPQPLLDQLRLGGRLVMPIGPSGVQEQLMLVTKALDGTVSRCTLGPASFVPLTGRGERTPELKGLYDRSIAPCFAGAIS